VVTTDLEKGVDYHPYSDYNIDQQSVGIVDGKPLADFYMQITLVDHTGTAKPLWLNVNGDIYPINIFSGSAKGKLQDGIHVHRSRPQRSAHHKVSGIQAGEHYENTPENRKLLNLFENYEDAVAYGNSEKAYNDSLKQKERELAVLKEQFRLEQLQAQRENEEWATAHKKELLELEKQREEAKAAAEAKAAQAKAEAEARANAAKERSEMLKYIPAVVIAILAGIGTVIKIFF
jgi:hypothetical protein